jgi:hypothetical protein
VRQRVRGTNTLCPPSLLNNSSHVDAPLVELADGIHSHTTFSAGQVISLGEAHDCISEGGERRAWLIQFRIEGANTLSDVNLERLSSPRSRSRAARPRPRRSQKASPLPCDWNHRSPNLNARLVYCQLEGFVGGVTAKDNC